VCHGHNVICQARNILQLAFRWQCNGYTYAYIELCLLLDETAWHKNAHKCYPFALVPQSSGICKSTVRNSGQNYNAQEIEFASLDYKLIVQWRVTHMICNLISLYKIALGACMDVCILHGNIYIFKLKLDVYVWG
jgi:hypothetical protein